MEIDRTVDEAYRHFRDVRVRDFVPLLVERRVVESLRAPAEICPVRSRRRLLGCRRRRDGRRVDRASLRGRAPIGDDAAAQIEPDGHRRHLEIGAA
ncbi:Uncharacterised protein [Gordonia terrae]|nr:Uncharacterised protein [Clostridioides difficile]VTS48777.1 Uncharacterised protein [Gordonia terrae]